MKLVPVLLLLQLVSVMESGQFDNKEFLIYNKKYPTARLTMFGTEGGGGGAGDGGTFTGKIYENQIWMLKPYTEKRGCYYIVNKHEWQYRIVDSKHSFGIYTGPLYSD
jgi:hypothetical protein